MSRSDILSKFQLFTEFFIEMLAPLWAKRRKTRMLKKINKREKIKDRDFAE